jgi:hypothetical protein
MRSGWISASTITPKTSDVEESAVFDGGVDMFINDGEFVKDETRSGERRRVEIIDLIVSSNFFDGEPASCRCSMFSLKMFQFQRNYRRRYNSTGRSRLYLQDYRYE